MVVVKYSTNSETSGLFLNPCYLADTLDSKLGATIIRSRDQNLDPDIRSQRWTSATENQGSIQSHVAGKTASCVLCSIVPMKDHRKFQLIANLHSVVGTGLDFHD